MRAAGILIFCLFASILSTVTSLKCQTCFAVGTECEEEDVKVKECEEDEEFCSSQIYTSNITGISLTLISKECSKRCFEGRFSATTVDGRFEVARANCCQTDLCNKEPIHLDNYEEFQPNWLQCPGCVALNEDYCEANQTVICVGQENQCLTATITTGKYPIENFTEKVSYQACTTQNSCYYPKGVSEIAGGRFQVNITTLECRNATSSEPDHQ